MAPRTRRAVKKEQRDERVKDFIDKACADAGLWQTNQIFFCMVCKEADVGEIWDKRDEFLCSVCRK